MKNYYWDKTSELIGNILKEFFKPEMSICEIGFGGGHFLEWLNDIHYKNLSGIEIREDQYLKTCAKFKSKGLNINLHLGDILKFDQTFDGIYATGLIQCLNKNNRQNFIAHVSKIASIAIFTVPQIKEERNLNSKQLVAVAGCTEYSTGNIPYDLSQYYDTVRIGTIPQGNTPPR